MIINCLKLNYGLAYEIVEKTKINIKGLSEINLGRLGRFNNLSEWIGPILLCVDKNKSLYVFTILTIDSIVVDWDGSCIVRISNSKRVDFTINHHHNPYDNETVNPFNDNACLFKIELQPIPEVSMDDITTYNYNKHYKQINYNYSYTKNDYYGEY